MDLIYNYCIKDLDKKDLHINQYCCFNFKGDANKNVFTKLIYSHEYNKKTLFYEEYVNNPCLFCYKGDNKIKLTINLPSFPYYGFNYPKMSYHKSCLDQLIQWVDICIFHYGPLFYKKRYHKLFLLSHFLIKDIINYIGLVLIKL